MESNRSVKQKRSRDMAATDIYLKFQMAESVIDNPRIKMSYSEVHHPMHAAAALSTGFSCQRLSVANTFLETVSAFCKIVDFNANSSG